MTFVASVELEDKGELALLNNVVNYKLTKDTWIGDTGALCHMRKHIDGMFNLKPGSGGIKVGSGKLLKILKVGKFRGEIQQKNGLKMVIMFKNVHFVPDMYCNLFSITAAMDKGSDFTTRLNNNYL